MSSVAERVILLDRDDLHWSFRETPPVYKTRKRDSGYVREIAVDPTPAYAHDPALVTALATQVEDQFPVACLPDYYLLSHEEVSRTNGHATKDSVYTRNATGTFEATGIQSHIVLGAKRIPIHPAMTRYLVTHEYGHVVQYAIEHQRGEKEEDGATPLEREYAALRGLDLSLSYGPGTWHRRVEELFANDFRILVAHMEREFWPHPGFPRPEELPAVRAFWRKALKTYR
jgi:hypothetical protein